jgi:hypothetical protein
MLPSAALRFYNTPFPFEKLLFGSNTRFLLCSNPMRQEENRTFEPHYVSSHCIASCHARFRLVSIGRRKVLNEICHALSPQITMTVYCGW